MFGTKAMRVQLDELAAQVSLLSSQCDELRRQTLDQAEEMQQLRSVQAALRLRLGEAMERSDQAATALLQRIEMKARC